MLIFVALLAGAALAFFLPEPFLSLKPALRPAFAITMLLVGTLVRPAEIRAFLDAPLRPLSGLAARLYTRLGLANRVRPFLNTVITNVPGPQLPLYFTGAKMVSTYGMGPVMDGMGLIHPVFSYSGLLSVGVTACRDQLPDPGFYAECIQDSFDELKEAAATPAP